MTSVTYKRRELLGTIGPSAPDIALTDIGQMVHRCWIDLPKRFDNLILDAFVVMPNHFHGIVLLNSAAPRGPAVSLQAVMHWFKTMTSTGYLNGVRERRWLFAGGHLWQRGYYDRVIRSDSELLVLRDYIGGNPGALWERVYPDL